jgi:hypothetical protein
MDSAFVNFVKGLRIFRPDEGALSCHVQVTSSDAYKGLCEEVTNELTPQESRRAFLKEVTVSDLDNIHGPALLMAYWHQCPYCMFLKDDLVKLARMVAKENDTQDHPIQILFLETSRKENQSFKDISPAVPSFFVIHKGKAPRILHVETHYDRDHSAQITKGYIDNMETLVRWIRT